VEDCVGEGALESSPGLFEASFSRALSTARIFLHRLQQFLRVVADAVFEDDLYVSTSEICLDGSPLITTRSAFFPAAMDPIWLSRPRYTAPFRVAILMASTGENPASTVTRFALIAETRNYISAPVGSGPAAAGLLPPRKRARVPYRAGTGRPGSFLCDALNADRSRRKKNASRASVVMGPLPAVGWEGARRPYLPQTPAVWDVMARDASPACSIRSFGLGAFGRHVLNVKSPCCRCTRPLLSGSSSVLTKNPCLDVIDAGFDSSL